MSAAWLAAWKKHLWHGRVRQFRRELAERMTAARLVEAKRHAQMNDLRDAIAAIRGGAR